jgi:hypothetical protein
VSVGTANNHRVGHAGSDEVVDVTPAAHEQSGIFQSLDRNADELHWRGNVTIRS